MKTMKFGMLAGLAACFVTAAAQADVTLTDLNSSVHFYDNGSGGLGGMDAWNVDGVDHLFEQWFWYRTGTDTREYRLDSLTQSITLQTGRLLELSHAGTGFSIDTLYVLTGGTAGSNFSDIAETIRIRNTGTSSITMSFYQYSDFDLGGTIPDSSVDLVNANLWRQTDIAGGLALNEASSIPTASASEANYFAATRTALDDSDIDILNGTTSAGPGDLTWAWQWNVTIGAGGSFIISKDKQIQPIPAPGAVVLAMMGMSLVGWAKRRMN